MTAPRATVFGEVAGLYDRIRPRYPPAMFDDLVDVAGLEPGASVLEIGPGTGIATAELLDRGFEVTGVDPDERMLDLARARLSRPLHLLQARFEDFDGDPSSFDLVFAAGSWHWIDPDDALPRVARLLRARGSLAVCWNLPRPGGSNRPAGLDDAYRVIAPELASTASQVRDRTQEHRRVVIANSGLFAQTASFGYRWSRALTTDEYCDLLATHSDHRLLGPERLATLLKAVAAIVGDAGGVIDLAYETVMYVARRRDRLRP